jgi:hypothetical protein
VKASELITVLQKRITEYGDLDVRQYDEMTPEFDMLKPVDDVRLYKRATQQCAFVIE